MTNNGLVNLGIIGLAIVGAFVLAPFVLFTVLGLSIGLFAVAVRVIGWLLAGALAGRLLRGEGYGPVADIALGIIGGVVGTFIFSLVGLGGWAENIFLSILVGAVGAIIFVYLVRLLDRNFAR